MAREYHGSHATFRRRPTSMNRRVWRELIGVPLESQNSMRFPVAIWTSRPPCRPRFMLSRGSRKPRPTARRTRAVSAPVICCGRCLPELSLRSQANEYSASAGVLVDADDVLAVRVTGVWVRSWILKACRSSHRVIGEGRPRGRSCGPWCTDRPYHAVDGSESIDLSQALPIDRRRDAEEAREVVEGEIRSAHGIRALRRRVRRTRRSVGR